MRPRFTAPSPQSLLSATLLAGAMVLAINGAAAAGWQPVDWKSFFHGSAAPPKSPPPESRPRLSRADGIKPDAMVDAFLEGLADALMARDAKSLLPRLSARYTVAGLPASENPRDVFAQAIERVPGPLEMEVRLVSTEKDGDRLATVEFRYPRDVTKTRRLRFDADGRLVASDLFAIRVESH